jgi:leader peptidase (prepilin peptidase)/N-methyltransferase
MSVNHPVRPSEGRRDNVLWIDIWFVAYLGLLGLVVGSFLNVVAWRLPRRQSIVRPPSACPACSHRLSAMDLVPVFSWLFLRGRCRYCGAPIAVRYPLVELLTGMVFAMIALGCGFSIGILVPLGLSAVWITCGLIAHDAGAAARRTGHSRRLRRAAELLCWITLAATVSAPWLALWLGH